MKGTAGNGIIRLVNILHCALIWCMCSGILAAQSGLGSFGGARNQSLGGLLATSDFNEALCANFSNSMWNTEFNSSYILGSERRYGLSEFKTSYGGFASPAGSHGRIGLSLSQFGFSLFKLRQAGLSYARMLHSQFAVSIKLMLEELNITSYGKQTLMAFALGMSLELNPAHRLSVYIENPEVHMTDHIPRTHSRFSIGLRRRQSEYLLIYIEAEHTPVVSTPVFKAGVDYKIRPVLGMAFGLGTYPGNAAFGISYSFLTHWNFALSMEYDLVSGLNPGVTLVWQKD